MKRKLVFLAMALVACSDPDQWPREGKFVGLYRGSFETSDFRPSGSEERWWLAGDIPCWHGKDGHEATPTLALEFKARLTPKGKHGHLGMYSREATPIEFIVCRVATPDEEARWKEEQ